MLTGERVVLRPFRPDDVEPLWRARLDAVTWAQTNEAPFVPETLAELRARYAEPSTGSSASFAVDAEAASSAGRRCSASTSWPARPRWG